MESTDSKISMNNCTSIFYSLFFISYFWDFGDSTFSNDPSPFYSFPEIAGINYTVTLIVDNYLGCINTSILVIFIADEIIYYVPNSFRPDGNGTSSTFSPIFTSGFDPYYFHLTIYNRWGENYI